MLSSSDDAAGSSAGTSSTADGSRADRRGVYRSMPSASATSTTPSTASANSRGPGFTAEDEAVEVATLSPCERIEIECDLRGISPEDAASRIFATKGAAREPNRSLSRDGTMVQSWLQLDTSIDEAVAKVARRRRRHAVLDGNDEEGISSDSLLRQLDRELRSIPDGEKSPYLQANERQCPDALITHPSGHSRFMAMLKYCGDDPRVAAKRIVEYWEERRRTFGEDRCYLPMALHGTMKDHVAVMLKQTTHQMLHHKDNAGRSILVFDISSSGSNDNESISAPESDKLEVRRRGAYPQSHALQTSFDAPNHVSFSSYY